MRRTLLALLLSFLVGGCQTNPHTGRKQFLAFSEETEVRMGVEAYGEVSRQAAVITDPELTDSLLRVGRAIANAANKPDYKWEFKLIKDDKTVNAWCLPGGKIAFYTGIYPILEDENGMAIVMGHEVSHAILRHGGERMSQQLAVGVSLEVLGAAASKSKYRDIGIAVGGAGATLFYILPFSRKQETEADKYGLELAARAGYDPRAAVRLWQSMAKLGGGSRPPQWLSTHPDPLVRVENMKKWMPEMMKLYEKSPKQPNGPLPRVVD